jgi:hypothetical protein
MRLSLVMATTTVLILAVAGLSTPAVAGMCWQSAANSSLRSNSLIAGKIQGISPKSGRSWHPHLRADNRLAAEFPTH